MHVSVCPACSAWAEAVQGLTHRLREAQPAEPAIGFALPRRRRARASAPVALVAAAAASLVAVLGASHSLLGSSQPARSGKVLRQGTAPAGTSLEDAPRGVQNLPTPSGRVLRQGTAPGVTSWETARFGLEILHTRSPAGVVLQDRFRAL